MTRYVWTSVLRVYRTTNIQFILLMCPVTKVGKRSCHSVQPGSSETEMDHMGLPLLGLAPARGGVGALCHTGRELDPGRVWRRVFLRWSGNTSGSLIRSWCLG